MRAARPALPSPEVQMIIYATTSLHFEIDEQDRAAPAPKA